MMKATLRTAVLLFFAITLVAAAPATAWADCTQFPPGILIGTDSGSNDSFTWTFSLINLTSGNVKIGAKGSTDSQSDNYLGSGFPYSTAYPPGNSSNSKSTGGASTSPDINLTTWKSNSHQDMFPDHCSTTVPFEISNDTAYNFSLKFSQYFGRHNAAVVIQPPFGQTTWKYSTSVSNDSGYYAFDPTSTAKSGTGEGNGILFAISDKYILSLYKNNEWATNGANDLILVVTERNSNKKYLGNKVRWDF